MQERGNICLFIVGCLLACMIAGCGSVSPRPRCIGERLIGDCNITFTVAPFADCVAFEAVVHSVSVLVDEETSPIAASIAMADDVDHAGAVISFCPPVDARRVDVIVQIIQAGRRFIMVVSFLREPSSSRWFWHRKDERVVDMGAY